MITAHDLYDIGDLAALFGVQRSTMRAMLSQPERHRQIDRLPAPIRTVGNAPVWDARAVDAALENAKNPPPAEH